eukprot:scaffold133982_cov26-Tisochrysis_lutea.AAC.1
MTRTPLGRSTPSAARLCWSRAAISSSVICARGPQPASEADTEHTAPGASEIPAATSSWRRLKSTGEGIPPQPRSRGEVIPPQLRSCGEGIPPQPRPAAPSRAASILWAPERGGRGGESGAWMATHRMHRPPSSYRLRRQGTPRSRRAREWGG